MNSWTKRLEIAVNIAILCAFIMIAALAAERLWSAHTNAQSSGPAIGTKVALSGVDWSKSNRNLVMALSTSCHFCSESADFYKKLLATNLANRGIPVIAVLPQTVDASRTYLSGLGVPIPELRQGSLDTVNVNGTPTLLIIDARGKIRKAWVGKLTPDREEQVMAALR